MTSSQAGQSYDQRRQTIPGRGVTFMAFRNRHFLTGVSFTRREGETRRCAIYLFIVVSLKNSAAKHARPVPLRSRVQLRSN